MCANYTHGVCNGSKGMGTKVICCVNGCMAHAKAKTGEDRWLCLSHMEKYLKGRGLSVNGLDQQAELRKKYVK